MTYWSKPLLAQEAFYYVLIGTALFCALIILVFFVLFLSYFRYWYNARSNQVPISFFDIIGMTFRKTPPSLIIDAMVRTKQVGIDDPSMTVRSLEEHHLAGGNISEIVDHMLYQYRMNEELPDFSKLCEMQLAGVPPFE